MSAFETTVTEVAGVRRGGVAAAAVEHRAGIFEMTQAAEDAVLRPKVTGAVFSHELRAALAARIARLSGDDVLADRHLARAGAQAPLADPSSRDDGAVPMLAFVDKVANTTRDITIEDTSSLRSAGMADPDIVRLCGIIAFMSYQIRVIAGLRLLLADA